MVVKGSGRVSVVLFVDRDSAMRIGDGGFGGDAARALAERELDDAGIPHRAPIEVEAFEGERGWMVFAHSITPAREAYFRFADADSMLDAVAAAPGGVGADIFALGPQYIIHMTAGDGPGFDAAAALFSEYGRRFEASPLYLSHLREHARR